VKESSGRLGSLGERNAGEESRHKRNGFRREKPSWPDSGPPLTESSSMEEKKEKLKKTGKRSGSKRDISRKTGIEKLGRREQGKI